MDESPRQLLRDACEAVADWINGAPCPDPAYFRSVINRLDALAESTSAAAIAFRYCERHDNESLAHGPTDDYARPYQERCDTCYGEWHGLPAFGCPGAYATPEQHAEYLQSHRRNIGHIPIWPTYTYYESFAPSTAVNDQALEGYTHIGYVDSDGIQHDNRLGVIRAICQSVTDLPGDEFANEPIGGVTIGCAICVNTGPRQPATRTVRNLRVCDEHAELVATFEGKDLAALFTAVRRDR